MDTHAQVCGFPFNFPVEFPFFRLIMSAEAKKVLKRQGVDGVKRSREVLKTKLESYKKTAQDYWEQKPFDEARF